MEQQPPENNEQNYPNLIPLPPQNQTNTTKTQTEKLPKTPTDSTIEETHIIPESNSPPVPTVTPETYPIPATQPDEPLASPSLATNNRKNLIQDTPKLNNISTPGSTPTDKEDNNGYNHRKTTPKTKKQLREEYKTFRVKKLTIQLQQTSFCDIGKLTNGTKDERDTIIALSMYDRLGSYDPSNEYLITDSDYSLTKTLHTINININKLNNDNKRMEFFQILVNKNFDIVFVQETQTKPDTISKMEKEWKGKSIWHSGPNFKNSGVAILFAKHLKIDIIKTETDSKGGIRKSFIQIENQLFQLINIYAPTNPKERLNFYKELPKIIEKRNNTILAGDFNILEDIFLDKLGGNTSNTHLIGLDILTEIKNKNNLVDILRKINPDKKLFTYHNTDKTIHSRLDGIYITNTIKVKTSKIYPISLPDHDGVTVIFQIRENNPRGPGIWKLNTSILKQKEFQEIFKNYWTYWQKQKRKYENQNLW